MATKDLIPTADVVIAAKKQGLLERKSRTPIEAVRALASMQKRPLPVLSAVADNSPVMLIGQVRYSISQSSLMDEPYDPVTTALRYAQSGLDAVALFTDEMLYPGGLDDLVMVSRAVNVPVISQDYILDEYQVVEARAAGASALVLSSAFLEPTLLRTLVSATQRNRMTAIVQINNEAELDYALSLSPYVIGITNRDPWTLEYDRDNLSRLCPLIPPHIRVMLLDDLGTMDEIAQAVSMGVHAVLMQETAIAQLPSPVHLAELLRRS